MGIQKITQSSIVGQILIFIFGGSILGFLSLLSGVKSCWTNLNADVEATISTQPINNKGSRTIAICLENENEEIDWAEIQIVPSFYNPTDYKVENLSISYDISCRNITFEPTDFFVKHRFSKGRDIYNYKEKELNSGDAVPSPFYSYSLDGNYGYCDIKTKLKHDGLQHPFEYNTKVHFIVVQNNKNVSFSEWMKICRKKMAEAISEDFCDAYFIDKNHHHEHDHSFALKNTAPSQHNNMSSSSSKSIQVKTEEAKINNRLDNKNLSIVSFEIVKQDSLPYLNIHTSEPTEKNRIYCIVLHKKNSVNYGCITFFGNGYSDVKFQLKNNTDFDYISFAPLNNNLKDKVVVKESIYKGVELECKENAVMVYSKSDKNTYCIVFSKNNLEKVFLSKTDFNNIKNCSFYSYEPIKNGEDINNEDLKVKDYKLYEKNGKAYIDIITNKYSRSDSVYYLALRNKTDGNYSYICCWGSGTKVMTCELNHLFESDYLTFAENNDSLKKLIKVETNNEGKIVINCSENAIIRYRIGDSEMFTAFFYKGGVEKRTLNTIGTASDVVILQAYGFDSAPLGFWDWVVIIIWGLIILLGIFFLIIEWFSTF